MSSRVINTILNLRDNFSSVINRVTSNTKKFERQIKLAERQAANMRKSVAGAFSSTGMKIAGALGGIGLATFAKDSLMLASNLAEVQNVVDTTFSSSANKINDFAKTTSSKFGMSELQAKKFSGTLGAMMKSSGITGDALSDMSTGLAGLAGDMASFYNLEPEESFEKLKSAIGGETEPMKALGVNMSVANMETYALTQGINKQWKEMNQAEQTVLRYKYLMQATKDAQGDYAKTCQGFANQLRTLKLNFQTFGATIMSYAIPPFQNLFSKMNDFITKFDIKSFMESKVVPAFKNIGEIIKYVGGNMTWIMPILSGVLSGLLAFMAIGKVISMVRGFMKVISSIGMLTNPVAIVAIAIGLLVTGMITAYKNSSTFREKIQGLIDKFTDFGSNLSAKILPIMDKVNLFLIDTLCPAMASLGEFVEIRVLPALGKFVDAFMDLAKTVWESISPAWDWIKANVLPDSFDSVKDAIVKVIDKATECVNFIKDNWGTIEPVIVTIVTAVTAWKVALIAVNTWTIIVGALTGIYQTMELAIWGVVNATSAWEAAQWLLNVAMDANPVGTVIGLLALLGLAIYEVVTHWQEIVEWCQKTWDKLNENPVLMFIATIISPLGVALIAIIAHWKDICEWVGKAWDWLNKWNDTDAKNKEVTVTKTEKNITDWSKPTDDNGNDPTQNSLFPKSPYKATGTNYWTGGALHMNEYGRGEMAVLPSGSKVIPAGQTDKLLSGAGGHVININFTGNVGTEEFFNQAGEFIANKVSLVLNHNM